MDDNFNTQVIGRYPIKTQLEGPGLSEAIALVQDAIAGTNYALWDHLAGIMSNDDEQVDQYCTEFITCPESNLAAAIAFNQTLPVPNQMSLEQCIALSQTITPEAVATEAITVVPRIGKSGDEIYFQKPGAYRGVAQINLARLAAIRDPRNVYQYGVLGLPYAVTAVRAAVGNGEGYVATYEIDKLWANFNPTDLSSLLHVEPAWVEAALSPRRSEVVISSESSNRPVPKMRESHFQKAKLGMFRGFPNSPISILTNLCLSKLQWRLSPHRHSVNYDNQFLIAADERLPSGRRRCGIAGGPGKAAVRPVPTAGNSPMQGARRIRICWASFLFGRKTVPGDFKSRARGGCGKFLRSDGACTTTGRAHEKRTRQPRRACRVQNRMGVDVQAISVP